MIISGGLNVYPKETEDVIARISGVVYASPAHARTERASAAERERQAARARAAAGRTTRVRVCQHLRPGHLSGAGSGHQHRGSWVSHLAWLNRTPIRWLGTTLSGGGGHPWLLSRLMSPRDVGMLDRYRSPEANVSGGRTAMSQNGTLRWSCYFIRSVHRNFAKWLAECEGIALAYG